MTDDLEWFVAHPERQLRIRRATSEEACGQRPQRPNCETWVIVGRDGSLKTFKASSEFRPPTCDATVASLLSDLTMARTYDPRRKVSVAG